MSHIRYSGQHLCRQHFIRFFEKRAKMNVAQQGRLPEGTVAVALSGGKDSVACLHFLHKISRDNPRVRLVAISVDEGIAGYRDGSLAICRDMTQELGIEWHVVRTRDLAGYSMDEFATGRAGPRGDAARALHVLPPEGRERPACSPCGVFRRVGINRLARGLGAAAVATGHNLDDMAQTVLMNVLGADVERLARLAPHDIVRPGMVPRLLPFRDIPEKEVLLYCLLEGLPVHDEECPYAARAHRFELRETLLGMEGERPGTRHSLLRFHERLRERLVPGAEDVRTCACGEPTSGDVCRACLWRAQ